MCAFSDDGNSLITITNEGYYYIAEIPKTGGECVLKDKKSLL